MLVDKETQRTGTQESRTVRMMVEKSQQVSWVPWESLEHGSHPYRVEWGWGVKEGICQPSSSSSSPTPFTLRLCRKGIQIHQREMPGRPWMVQGPGWCSAHIALRTFKALSIKALRQGSLSQWRKWQSLDLNTGLSPPRPFHHRESGSMWEEGG